MHSLSVLHLRGVHVHGLSVGLFLGLFVGLFVGREVFHHQPG